MKLPLQVDLKNKVAVITGGSGVLGRAFAKALAQSGARVAILGRNADKANKVAEEIKDMGGDVIGVSCDVVDPESMKTAREIVIKELGPCDILINGAGGNHPSATTTKDYFYKDDRVGQESLRSFFDLAPEDIQSVFNLNFLGTLIPTQTFARDMNSKDAVIINISSMSACTPLTRIAAYSGAKAAISNFTQWLAVHFSKAGIRVNAIAPGFFLSEQNHSLLISPEGTYTERAQKILNMTPMGRFGEAEELIGTLLWLCSDASRFVTGVIIPVDGGFSAYSGV